MAHDVFITYSSPDKSVAEAVCAVLESRHIRCWIAPRDVLPGTEWAEAIVDAINGSRVLVLVLSSSSNSSPQVIREVGRAASKGIPIVPFRIDDVSLSKAMDFFISAHHWLDAQTPPLEKHLQRLADTVHQLLAQQGEVAEKATELPVPTRKPEAKPVAVRAPPAEIAEEAGRRKRWLKPALIACGVVAVVVLIVVGVTSLGRLEPPAPPAAQESTVTTPPAAQESTVTTPPVVQEPPTTTPKQAPPPAPTIFATFPDKNLDAVIRSALGKQAGDEITASQLANLRGLVANRQGIVDLTGIEYCVNFNGLGLSQNQISDISALSPLTNLTRLILRGNQISDISPLSSLTNLSELHLEENQISDISPLSSLTNLSELYLWQNQISDISPLSKLTNLIDLQLQENQISDISPLSKLTNLIDLQLQGNQISDILPLSKLTNLIDLQLQGNQISDISTLSSLTNLEYLNLLHNQIRNIQPLVANAGLSEGDQVILTGNPLSSTSLDVYIPQLKQRGVTVEFD